MIYIIKAHGFTHDQKDAPVILRYTNLTQLRKTATKTVSYNGLSFLNKILPNATMILPPSQHSYL